MKCKLCVCVKVTTRCAGPPCRDLLFLISVPSSQPFVLLTRRCFFSSQKDFGDACVEELFVSNWFWRVGDGGTWNIKLLAQETQKPAAHKQSVLPVSRLVSVVDSSRFNIISCDWIIIFPLDLIKLISFVLFAAVLGSDRNKSMLTCCRDWIMEK